MHRTAYVGWLLVVGCTVGAPAGFSEGDHWTLPLVGPLEDGLLLTPVTVRGHGPYLFAIDPDANVTAIDQHVVREAQLRGGVGPKRIDETDTGQTRFYAELLDLKVGDLTIARRDAMVFPAGFYNTEGRVINGVLGRDAIPDSLVFGFDRDQGIAILSTTKAFTPPPDAIRIDYETIVEDSTGLTGREPPGSIVAKGGENRERVLQTPYNDVPGRLNGAERTGLRQSDIVPVQRRLAQVQIGDAQLAMHLDLGAAVSQLRESKWPRARVARVPARLRVTDEAATARSVTTAAVATDVALGPARAPATFVPYVEKRFVVESVDGALGLDFFQRYAVYAHWDKRAYYLKPRADAAATTTARLGRWGTALPACPHPGCVVAELVTSGGSTTLHVVRDAEAANRGLEVFLHAAPAPGKSTPPLLVELPAATDKLSGAMPAAYAGATLAVADAAPFPRSCADPTGCILPLGVPAGGNDSNDADKPGEPPPAEPAAPEPGPGQDAGAAPVAQAAAPRTVVATRLHRLTGDAAIPPSDDVKQAAAGQPLAVAIVKLCLRADGKVEAATLIKSSGVAAYDTQLQDTIRSTWSFAPVAIDGKLQPVCAMLTFKS